MLDGLIAEACLYRLSHDNASGVGSDDDVGLMPSPAAAEISVLGTVDFSAAVKSDSAV
jgi:hypothetical protein